MFSIASHYPEGSLGRQLAWIFVGGWAIIVFAVGLSQPDIAGEDPILKVPESGPKTKNRPCWPMMRKQQCERGAKYER